MKNTTQWAAVCHELMALIKERQKADASLSYTANLLQGNEDALLKKLVEEASEAVLAAKSGGGAPLAAELADLWFHCFIIMTRYNITLPDVAAVLAARRGVGGLVEKAARNKSIT